jgi:hypothetical protein
MYKRILFVVMLLVTLVASSISAQEEGDYTLQILHSSDNESSFQDSLPYTF